MKKYCVILITFLMALPHLVAQNLSGVTILVNPGHGGYDSDDRNMVIAPFSSGDPNGFWESQCNLDKGAQLKSLLLKSGAQVLMTRTTNTTADDLPLSQIVGMANQARADYMLSIHSNAGVTNYILQLYAGIDVGDTNAYPTPTPYSDESRAISAIIAQNQYTNQANTWASAPTVRGDKTFARTAMGWSDGYGVLRGLAVPGCISEGSMHDYIPETYRLMNMEYKWLEAWHFYKSFCTYFNAGPINTGNIAGTIHDSRNLNMGNYYKMANTKDVLLPLLGAKITVNPGNLVYTTDNLYNGVYVFKELEPGTYTVTAEATGYTSQTINMTVEKDKTTYMNFMLNKVRDTPPEVVEFTPNPAAGELVKCATPITFKFNWDVDVESARNAFTITPAVDGVITFEDSQYKMIFTPNKPFDTNTLYTVKLAKSLMHPAGLSMVNDFTFQFTTDQRNRLLMVAHTPKSNDSLHFTGSVFEFRFDKALDPILAKDGIKIFDDSGNELSKNLRSVKINKVTLPHGSMAFNLLNDLVVGKNYTVKMDRTLIDKDGVDIVDPIQYTFKAMDVRVANKPIVETFETLNSFVYDASQSSGVTSAQTLRSTTAKLFNSYSYSYSYTFSGAKEGAVVYKVPTPSITVVKDKVLGLHIYGDLSRNELQLQFTAADDIRFVQLTDLDFMGWKFAEVKLNTLPTGQEYKLTGIKVVQKEDILTQTGLFYLDDMLLYDQLVSSVNPLMAEWGVKVYPNPATDRVRVVYPGTSEPRLSLYTLSGELVRSMVGSELDVTAVSVGTYLLKVELNDLTSTYPLIIVR